MPNGVNNQVSRLPNPRFRSKPLFDTRTNANPTGSTTMGPAGMSALERVQGTAIRPPFPPRSPELNRIGGPPAQSNPFNFMRNLLGESGESGLRTLLGRKFIPGISREPQGGGLRDLLYRYGVGDPGSPNVQLAGGSPTPLFSSEVPSAAASATQAQDAAAARPAPPQAMPPVAGSDQGLGEKLKAYRRKLESSPPREFTGPVQSYTPSPEARDQLAELDREIAQYNRVGQLAPGMAELRERQRAAMGSPAAARAYLDRQDPRFASMFRRFPGGQGAGQGAGQVSEAKADANYAKLLAGGEEMRGRDGLMVSQVGDRPKVDLSADEAAEQLMRRGDYYAYSPDGTGSSIFSKRRREQIRDQSLTKDRYFAPELAKSMGLDPSTRFALKEQGEDGLVDTAYAKSAQRQEMLGERTGRLTQDAKAILKAAGVPTAGVRGKKKIEEAWMQYRENMAKEKTQAPKAIGITAATQALNRMKEGKGATEGEQVMFNTLSGMGIAADSSAEDIMNTIHDRAGGQFDFDEQVAIIQHIQNKLAADKKRKGAEGIFGENAAWSRGNVGVLGSGELPEAQRKAIESAEDIDTSDPEAVGKWFSGALESQYAKEEERPESSPRQKPQPRSGPNRKMFSPPTGY